MGFQALCQNVFAFPSMARSGSFPWSGWKLVARIVGAGS